jgi:hypothetical protein
MVPMMPVPLGHWRFFQELAERVRARSGDAAPDAERRRAS